uniref:Variant surface glycoprotein 1125.1477 n=1 Tax=Trypanosoma brucei TaxID=5691 RepID=A0A1J0R731_9TRYP|nr:variant surface glycoprotein 1125.1477 [Trypanosoma brucei]
MAALTKVLTLLRFLLLALPSEADMGDGGNRAEHAALCAFISMAGRKLEIPVIEPLNDEAYKYLQELNFTLAPKDWQSQFYKDTDRSAVHANAQDSGLKNRGEDKYWADWAAAAEAFKKGATTIRIQSGDPQDLGNESRAIAAAEIAEITEHAAQIRSGYPDVAEQKKLYEPTNPPASVAIAIFGDAASTADNLVEDKVFGKAVGNAARENACSTTGADPKPLTAMAMLTCVCGRANANAPTNFECTKAAKPSGTWTTSSTAHTKPDMEKLAKSCGPPPAAKITLEEIRTAIARFRSLVHTDATHGYFGHYEQTNCDGNSGNGICVKFTN